MGHRGKGKCIVDIWSLTFGGLSSFWHFGRGWFGQAGSQAGFLFLRFGGDLCHKKVELA